MCRIETIWQCQHAFMKAACFNCPFYYAQIFEAVYIYVRDGKRLCVFIGSERARRKWKTINTHPVYSYHHGCVKCESNKYRWIKFIAAAFLPLTLFYIIVITFRISVTSSTLNTFVMVNQLIAISRVIRMVYSKNLVTCSYHVSYASQITADFIVVLSSVWNLDFFHSFY